MIPNIFFIRIYRLRLFKLSCLIAVTVICHSTAHAQGGGILPLYFTSVNAKQDVGCTAFLSWTYTNGGEITESFIIERSYDGRNFEPIATLPDSSNKYLDKTVIAGIRYYRIKAHSTTDRMMNSDVKVVKGNGCAGATAIYPNPTHNVLKVTGIMNICELPEVYNTLGQKMQITANAINDNLLELNLAALPCGLYHFKMGTINKNFIKQ